MTRGLANRALWGLLGAVLLLGGLRIAAGWLEPAATGLTEHPCPPPESGFRHVARTALLTLAGRPPALRDWADLCFYQSRNADLIARGARPEAVFIGDSITQYWAAADPNFFHGERINSGIAAQTSPQVLLRLTPDAIALRPGVIHILVGTNDVIGLTGPSRPDDYRNNIKAMVTLARASGAAVVIGLVPPASGKIADRRAATIAGIRTLNGWLLTFAREQGLTVADYWTPLAAPDGALRPELAADPSHPNEAGYAVMKPIALAAIAEAARRSAAPAAPAAP